MHDTGARYEIIIDGVTRTHRDDRKFALEAAALLRSKASGRRVVVKDLATQEIIDPPGKGLTETARRCCGNSGGSD
jgi:hypothetical protein